MDKLIRRRSRKKRNGESGLTMIELMIAGFILVVGMLGFAALMATAIAANMRSRTDSTATMLSQTVLEQLAASLVGTSGATAPTIKDCAGNVYNINVSAGGATLDTSTEFIDWTQSASSITGGSGGGYQMYYEICASTSNTTTNAQQHTYDVRWNVQSVSGTNTYLIVVGARPKNYSTDQKYFALPVGLKMYVTAAAQ